VSLWLVTALDHQRVAEWIGDAFAILCVRHSGLTDAETNLRLGFERILRHLRIPPLGVVARSAPVPYRPIVATTCDLRHIAKALDSCLSILERYEAVLTPAQREMKRLVQEARLYAEQEIESRLVHTVELVAV
jgi:hypothetical protein